jgi:hypothetical protein
MARQRRGEGRAGQAQACAALQHGSTDNQLTARSLLLELTTAAQKAQAEACSSGRRRGRLQRPLE